MSSTAEHRPLRVESRKVEELTPYERNSKIHDKKQVKQIAASTQEFGFNVPVLIDGQNRIIAGHGRVLAAKQLGMDEVPTIAIYHLTDAQRRAFIIADNKLTENSSWNTEMLALEFKELGSLDLSFELEITGFDTSEMDLILLGDDKADDDLDAMPDIDENMPAICKLGDIWQLGDHRLMCGDSRDNQTYVSLLGEKKADMIIADPPYNVPIGGNAVQDKKPRHGQFAMAFGEMSSEEFTDFLESIFKNLTAFSKNGSIHYIFMNWRSQYEILTAGRSHYKELKNLCVWNKSNVGLGTFYRNKHEFIFVFKNGNKPHTNNVEWGADRFRSNVWDYPSANSFSKDSITGETKEQRVVLHPTVLPVAMFVDMMLDCSKAGQLILDPFCGSGTNLIAAQKTNRRCYGIEYEPRFVDAAIDRWEKFTAGKAVLQN
jgi:DNA modification methylase